MANTTRQSKQLPKAVAAILQACGLRPRKTVVLDLTDEQGLERMKNEIEGLASFLAAAENGEIPDEHPFGSEVPITVFCKMLYACIDPQEDDVEGKLEAIVGAAPDDIQRSHRESDRETLLLIRSCICAIGETQLNGTAPAPAPTPQSC